MVEVIILAATMLVAMAAFTALVPQVLSSYYEGQRTMLSGPY